MIRLLSGESSELFLGYFKQYLPALFEETIQNTNLHLPVSFLQNYLVGSFTDTVKWWIYQDFETAPEVVAGYYMDVLKHGLGS